ncbi:MAG TPA: hypothetical protein PLN52_24265, partial [Opitutaceae bacterium]|nr:hypothetical protein [Opitutaceae bacterium]
RQLPSWLICDVRQKMKKPTQVRLADWAFTCASVSAVLPVIALLAIVGLGHWNWFSLQCVGLGVLCALTLWVFHKMKKKEFALRRSGWALGIVYFAVIIFAVARFLESLGLTLLLAAPESVGIVICVIGLLDSQTPSALAKNEA